MSDSFNGYHVWLGIPLSEQPPNHYRLLGIAIFESDLDVIDHAADRQMAHVRTFQSGRHAALSQRILNELAAARVCLLTAERKAEYDESLRAKFTAVAAVPVGKAVPVAPVATPERLMPPGANPAKRSGANPPASRVAPVVAPERAEPLPKADQSAGVAPAHSVGTGEADDEDPFGLLAASGRRPRAAKGKDTGSLFDDVELKSGSPKINVDLARRPANSDIFIQKLAIYGFVAVAGIVMLMVIWNTLQRNFGPVNEWFRSPEIAEPAIELPKHAAPPAPLPGSTPPPKPAEAGNPIENGG